MWLVRPGIPRAVRFEEPAPQHLRNVFLADGLDAFLLLPPDDIEQIGLERLAEIVMLVVIGGEQRRDESRSVHFGDRLHEMLEEIHDPLAPELSHARLAARVHQYLVDQDQGAETPLLRQGQQPRDQWLGRRGLTLLVLAVGMDRAEPLRAGKLKREHAPRMLERARLAVRRPNPVDPPLDVDLVEAERHRERLRQLRPHVLPELLNRLDVGQRGRISKQVVERNEGMGLSAAIGQLELPHRLGALPVESLRHVLDELAQGRRCKGQGKEPLGVLIDGPPAFGEGDLVEIGSELRQGQLAASQLVLEAHDLMPRLRSGGGHVSLPPVPSVPTGCPGPLPAPRDPNQNAMMVAVVDATPEKTPIARSDFSNNMSHAMSPIAVTT